MTPLDRIIEERRGRIGRLDKQRSAICVALGKLKHDKEKIDADLKAQKEELAYFESARDKQDGGSQ